MARPKQPEKRALPPLLFPGRTSTERRRLAELKAAKRIREIGPRLYTSLHDRQVPAAVRGAWSTVVSTLFPNALVSHRSALEFIPSPTHEIIITSRSNRVVAYPGLQLRFVRGPAPLVDDPRFMSIRSSSRPRAFLENLLTTHPESRTRVLSVETVEERLEQILHIDGEAELLQMRDRARVIAKELDWRKAFERLDRLIGMLLRTRPGVAASAVGNARAIGAPYDAACLERLQLLFGELRTRPLPKLLDERPTPEHLANKAFFEAYFSNYIEGTRFEIEEAERIVFDGAIPERRPIDAHDIAGTFQIVSDANEMRRAPTTFDELVRLVRERHRRLMDRRPEVRPGEFKDRPNLAGNTTFVAPEYVMGTLKKGFELHVELPAGLARAIFMMFLIADVHPFTDGNGRIARIMMNAELHAAGLTTIIIPTAYREEYIDTLRALTRRHRPAPLVQALTKAQAFSHLDFATYPKILAELQRRNWFRESEGSSIILDTLETTSKRG